MYQCHSFILIYVKYDIPNAQALEWKLFKTINYFSPKCRYYTEINMLTAGEFIDVQRWVGTDLNLTQVPRPNQSSTCHQKGFKTPDNPSPWSRRSAKPFRPNFFHYFSLDQCLSSKEMLDDRTGERSLRPSTYFP